MQRILLSVLGVMFVVALSATPAKAQSFGADEEFSGISAVTATNNACNGGTCQTQNGQTLNCPTSGGPTCGSEQDCTCVCASHNNSYYSYNKCAKKPKNEAVQEHEGGSTYGVR